MSRVLSVSRHDRVDHVAKAGTGVSSALVSRPAYALPQAHDVRLGLCCAETTQAAGRGGQLGIDMTSTIAWLDVSEEDLKELSSLLRGQVLEHPCGGIVVIQHHGHPASEAGASISRSSSVPLTHSPSSVQMGGSVAQPRVVLFNVPD